jgi:hypothetical protein
MVAEYESYKSQEALAKKKSDDLKSKLLKEFDARGVDTIEWDDGRVTKTQAESVTISIDILSELVSPRILRKVTTRVIDKTMLSAAVQDGSVTPEDVVRASTIKKNAPYIRVSHGTGD